MIVVEPMLPENILGLLQFPITVTLTCSIRSRALFAFNFIVFYFLLNHRHNKIQSLHTHLLVLDQSNLQVNFDKQLNEKSKTIS